MAFKDPKAIAQAGVEKGQQKARLSWDKAIVAGFLAGAYIAFGGLLAATVSAGMDERLWGGMITFVSGAVFSLGLILVVIAGSELLTGNMALVPLAAMRGRASFKDIAHNWSFVLLGNLLGALFVAYFLADQTGVASSGITYEKLGAIADKKGIEETEWQIFLRAMGCNWLVCLAVWLAFAAEDIAGKILAIFFPIMAFVAMGFDHVVANMFFLPAAIFTGAGGVDWWDAVHNWIFAFAGNLVGAVIFVSGAYYYLYARPEEQRAPAADAGDQPPAGGTPGETMTDMETAGR